MVFESITQGNIKFMPAYRRIIDEQVFPGIIDVLVSAALAQCRFRAGLLFGKCIILLSLPLKGKIRAE